MPFYRKYTRPPTFENLCQAVQNEDFARASELKAKRDTILTGGGESRTSATISSSASSRLLPAPPKCVIGLELTARVPRQIGMWLWLWLVCVCVCVCARACGCVV